MSKLISLNDETFDDFLKNNDKVVVKFGASWCAPCKILNPILENLADENKNIPFCEIDADECPKLIKKFNIKSVPLTMFFKNNELVSSISGATSKQKLFELIKL